MIIKLRFTDGTEIIHENASTIIVEESEDYIDIEAGGDGTTSYEFNGIADITISSMKENL